MSTAAPAEVTTSPAAAGPDAGTTPTPLVVRGLVKRFGARAAVDGVDLVVRRAEVHGLVGPNGAGKTTVLRSVLGLVRPDAGAVHLFDRTHGEHGPRALDGVAGFVEVPHAYPYLTARANLELLAVLDGDGAAGRVDDALAAVSLRSSADERAGGFSLGMRQRLGLAAALLRAPRLLVLDEPANGLDPAGARDLRALVRDLAATGTAVLLSSHDMAEVEDLCDQVTVLRSGRVAHRGTVEQLRRRAPASTHRLTTSDDAQALVVARAHPGVEVAPHAAGGLAVRAATPALDGCVVALGRAGVAVRRLAVEVAALESLLLEPGR